MTEPVALERIDAVTLLCADMARSVAFYAALGFPVRYGGADAPFTTFAVGSSWLNVQAGGGRDGVAGSWGRVIIWVDDVDAMYRRCIAAGAEPEAPPDDASWGERYFHVRDPDGHELSFARPLG